MRRFIWASFYIAGGILTGCFSAFALIQNAGMEELEPGAPWHSRSGALIGQENFYVRAHYLLGGRLPPAPGQLTEAVAAADSQGRPLTGACAYRIASTGPLPRWWSISIIGNPAGLSPHQVTADASSVIRNGDGKVEILAYPSPRPGNWLKSPTARRYTILYSAVPQAAGPPAPPFTITAEGCL